MVFIYRVPLLNPAFVCLFVCLGGVREREESLGYLILVFIFDSARVVRAVLELVV